MSESDKPQYSLSTQNHQFKLRRFEITGDAGVNFKPIDAVAQFEYKGFVISFSTAGRSIGACQNEVQILKSNGDYLFPDGFHSVEDAINFLN